MIYLIIISIVLLGLVIILYPRLLSKKIVGAFSQDTKRLADNTKEFAKEVEKLTENQKRMIDGYFHSIEVYLKTTSDILEKLKERDGIIAKAIEDGNVKLSAFLETLKKEKEQ